MDAQETCGGSELPNWAMWPVMWDLGDVLVANVNMAATTNDNSTIGLVFIDKATGVARRTGAGDASCGASGRIWPHTPVFGLLCVLRRLVDLLRERRRRRQGHGRPTRSSLAAATLNRGRTVSTQERPQGWLFAYDLTTGARRWSTRLELPTRSPGGYDAAVRHLASLGGSLLVNGYFPLDESPLPIDQVTDTLLIDAGTGTIVQRWNSARRAGPGGSPGAECRVTNGLHAGRRRLLDLRAMAVRHAFADARHRVRPPFHGWCRHGLSGV